MFIMIIYDATILLYIYNGSVSAKYHFNVIITTNKQTKMKFILLLVRCNINKLLQHCNDAINIINFMNILTIAKTCLNRRKKC